MLYCKAALRLTPRDTVLAEPPTDEAHSESSQLVKSTIMLYQLHLPLWMHAMHHSRTLENT